jgi:hypothetical protein
MLKQLSHSLKMKNGLILSYSKVFSLHDSHGPKHGITLDLFFTEQERICALQKHHCFFFAASWKNESYSNQNFIEGSLDPCPKKKVYSSNS